MTWGNVNCFSSVPELPLSSCMTVGQSKLVLSPEKETGFLCSITVRMNCKQFLRSEGTNASTQSGAMSPQHRGGMRGRDGTEMGQRQCHPKDTGTPRFPQSHLYVESPHD